MTLYRSFHVQAHRGASAERLENTLPAFERAIEVGASSVELDLHLSRDGHLVVTHDFVLSRDDTTGRDGLPIPHALVVHQLSLEELWALDVRNPGRLRFPDTSTPETRRVPTLDEVFALFRRSPRAHARVMWLDLEIKSDPARPELSAPPGTLARSVKEAVEKGWEETRTVVRSFDFRVLSELRRLAPKLKLAALTDEGFHDYERVARELKPDIVAPHWGSISKEEVESLHAHKIRVLPWTANLPRDWDHLLAMGVDGITTDDPLALKTHLRMLI